VVLLDMVATRTKDEFVVAHFDHGIRSESGKDAEFVGGLAKKYGAVFELGQARLGAQASEEMARKARYSFLKKLEKKYAPAKVVTAHHQDDLVETVVMNLVRGTGWRGLAPMSAELERPLLGLSKVELTEYAIANNLGWIEDETNYGDRYFRNRVRRFLLKMSPEQRRDLLILNAKQQLLRGQIEEISRAAAKTDALRSPAILALPVGAALELLRAWTGGKLTTPQLKLLLKKLKSAKSGDLIQPGGKMQIGVYGEQLTRSEISG
jgi:tRNA(Ile)-lysidine synthase